MTHSFGLPSSPLQAFLLALTALFVALDIIGTVPMYLAISERLPKAKRISVVNTSMGVAFLVAILFVFLGRALFRHLGIELFDFKVAGGIILLLVSLADLVGGPEAAHQKATGQTGIVPLAVPLITGPGVLTTLILQVGTAGYPITIAALLVNYLFAWIILQNCEAVTKVLGKDGTVVLSKIAALLLAAIAIAMIRSGVFEAITAFRS